MTRRKQAAAAEWKWPDNPKCGWPDRAPWGDAMAQLFREQATECFAFIAQANDLAEKLKVPPHVFPTLLAWMAGGFIGAQPIDGDPKFRDDTLHLCINILRGAARHADQMRRETANVAGHA